MKVLALENEVVNATEDDFRPHLKAEAAKVWELCQAGVIREIYFRGDARRAVLILECGSREEAQQILGTLPLVKEGLTDFEVVPLTPYTGFSRLFALGL
ncbi:MAG TPA: muconolactone Delta-isomerase family protein [Candidatus Acidoferrum sp.]|nr:muconolactone Delta-isomerase family protein [Candidatus Acidoferrum sp.]